MDSIYEYTQNMDSIIKDITDNDFKIIYSTSDFEKKYDEFLKEKGQSGRFSILGELRDMFKNNGIEGFHSAKDYEKCLKYTLTEGQIVEKYEEHYFDTLYNIYKEFPTSSNFMERIVKKLADDDFKEDSTRVAILKQFLRYTNFHTGPIKKLVKEEVGLNDSNIEDIIDYIDDRIFKILDQDLTKIERRTYELLLMSDNLASGKFKTNNGKTRVYLYMFAFVFKMKYYLDKDDPEYNVDKDFEKNLFFDYYNDNLLRYISHSYKSKPTEYESEPTGEGINYKNFAEIIYLYFLNKDNMSAKKKIARSNAIIKECLQNIEKKELDKNDPFQETQVYKKMFMSTICDLDEEALVKFISNNFYIPKSNLGKSNIEVASNTVTANEEFNKIVEKLIDISPSQLHFGTGIEEFEKKYSKEDPEFLELLRAMDNKLYRFAGKSQIDIFNKDMRVRDTKSKLQFAKESDIITRTDLIVLYYYYYIEEKIDKDKNLADIFNNFCKEINNVLIKARYPQISVKNIFDMYVIFSLYHYMKLL